MHFRFLILMFAVASCAADQSLPINPTTTLRAETSNNTSAADSFLSQTNGNSGAGNVSKLNVHTLLYPGATTRIYAHFMPWWGDKKHMSVGYNSHDPAQIHRQILDMISRGIDGTILDWYGPADFTDQTAKLVMAEAEQHPGFSFAIMIDKGAIDNSPCPGCDAQQTLISLVQYVEQNYVPSPAYMRVKGQPVLTNFDIDLHFAVDWIAVKAASSTNPDFLFQHKGGFAHAVSGGSYSWIIVNVTDEGMDYLSQFYAAGKGSPLEETIGAAYKGFNDSLASWGSNRIMDQQCGQTWLKTFQKINSLYDSTHQLDALQLVTWNDYEEGTELETGIDNCISIAASLSGSTLNWKVSGNENTIDHYVIYISNDGNNLMPLETSAPGSSSLDLCTYAFVPGNYSAYVQAVGKPAMRNQMSAGVKYLARCEGAGGEPESAVLVASPSALSLQWGQSGTTQVAFNGSLREDILFSCENLPAGVTCSFSSVSFPAGTTTANSILTLTTNHLLFASDEVHQSRLRYGILFPSLGAAGFLLVFMRRNFGKFFLLGSLSLATAMCNSCGGRSTGPTPSVAPAQSFAITLNGNYGNSVATTQLMLTLR